MKFRPAYSLDMGSTILKILSSRTSSLVGRWWLPCGRATTVTHRAPGSWQMLKSLPLPSFLQARWQIKHLATQTPGQRTCPGQEGLKPIMIQWLLRSLWSHRKGFWTACYILPVSSTIINAPHLCYGQQVVIFTIWMVRHKILIRGLTLSVGKRVGREQPKPLPLRADRFHTEYWPLDTIFLFFSAIHDSFVSFCHT